MKRPASPLSSIFDDRIKELRSGLSEFIDDALYLRLRELVAELAALELDVQVLTSFLEEQKKAAKAAQSNGKTEKPSRKRWKMKTTLIQAVMDYMNEKKAAKLSDIAEDVARRCGRKDPQARKSVRRAVSRLVERGLLKRVEPGYYALAEEKREEASGEGWEVREVSELPTS